MTGPGIASRPPSPLRHRNFALFVVAMLGSTFAGQMVLLGIQWQVYAIRHHALDLGLIGLAEFTGLLLVALPAGHLADRLPRRLVLEASIALNLVVTGLLLAVSLSGASSIWPFLALAVGSGVASAIGWPASRAMTPSLVPAEILQSALALRTMTMQMAVIAAPAIAGVLLTVGASVVYGVAMALLGLSFVVVLFFRAPRVVRTETLGDESMLSSLRAGLRFVRRTPVLLGAITLDLFAVLFGGAISLAPLFAVSILHAGSVGAGLLRAAPAAGALVAGYLLMRRPLRRRVGRTLMTVVAVFGVTQIVFGLSKSLPLSLAVLAIGGFVDMISMNIRATTVALATPDELRGRVNAVEMVFISASNELGAFESGGVAAAIGAVASVVAGGTITIALALGWPRLFPSLGRIDRFEDLEPAPVGLEVARVLGAPSAQGG
ncbi:MAG: MFS transporter [Gaiellaceae bacterium]